MTLDGRRTIVRDTPEPTSTGAAVMRKLISSLKTSRAARRGSVLILCVVLIVILVIVRPF